ncbi:MULTISPECIES: diguanylate cyclase domain-containing protein [Pseudomonas]|mgnify:FL=1|jgi:two-component system chemotaxis family response regulator WspR|uniref:diguanylate cyclase domain-containing protein n=1 Tax=Pseudomonas TaxID=286 RepID=UPI0004933D36|nr:MULTISPECIES: diguanylate cyclase [Pseudomonas]TDR48954.1 response regulator receiver modulated diguanylate cyclase [Pseudomonas brenneri]VVN87863.1 Chemotaxis response regulator protein-glutamate methylesterase [Pseudomonas fluorescens]MBC3339890.1 diguanylate cyclase [Pseudomonas proteolytica]MDF3164015.1 diguanylate cyclase [Pseudomonas proteolytica]NMY96310.1 diguanylate cyclase [Pseudomonas proteolytica]
MNDLQLDDFKTDENAAMVLLVDDQAMIGEAVRRGLAHEDNIDFHFCADPHQAISQAIRIKPTVILQDLVMPGLDGLTLVREYRNHPATQNIPIIVLSTKEDPLIKSAAFAAGANDYLVKLPDNIELVARIRYHSRSYMTLLQRDAAYRALRVSQQQLLDTNLVLQRLMNSDGLTGLSNRRHFDEYLELEWRRAMRDQTQLSLLMIDVDFFKTYNDSFGHLEGDEALRKVAATIRDASSRPSDLPARYGGEEFALVLPNTSPGGARLVAEKLRQAVAALKIPHIAPSDGASLTISIGLATMTPLLGTDCRQLISAADKGLYLAKHNGRNQVGIE